MHGELVSLMLVSESVHVEPIHFSIARPLPLTFLLRYVPDAYALIKFNVWADRGTTYVPFAGRLEPIHYYTGNLL